jgi:hypothetical protein
MGGGDGSLRVDTESIRTDQAGQLVETVDC